MKKISILLLSFLMFSFALIAKEKIKEKINSSDINDKYEIIGPLGFPLGKLINIKAIVLPDPGKGFSNWLLVTNVNGKKIKKAVRINYTFWDGSKGVHKLKKGQTYKLRIYQDGGMIGVPHQVMKETYFVQTWGYHFNTKAVIVKAEKI